ncbi:MAG: CsoS2 family carboxysome shell protein [Gammaproteobacteria bacterium]|nr:CsoS2 family carboxysome shell protein [Gammaproteobacteria bacterium]MBU4500125.1 CsoS2 family carboxysome shell protein [Gammaproteobacteria bacterium]
MSQATPDTQTERMTSSEAAMARRRALSLYGKAGLAGGKAAASTSATQARLAAQKGNTSASPVSVPAATPPVAAASAVKPACGCQPGVSSSTTVEYASPKLVMEPISAAQQRRIDQSLRGRGDAPPCRPCGRVKPEPPKVEFGTTLAGTPVSGNQVERTASVTGNESGSCRAITGTEYIGTEQFSQFCNSKPAASPSKVGASTTSRGGRVTGTEVGRSEKVTGDETGTCKRVTGTEYIAAEQAGAFCGTSPEPRPEKAGFGMTAMKNAISGSDLARENGVTGGEHGSNRAISGSAYIDPSPSRSRSGAAPKKVETSHTSAGGAVSGTQLGRSSKISGAEQGACKRVTGSDYLSAEEFSSFCRAEPYQSPAKVGVSRTLKGQDVSGTLVGRSASVTGDEYGACKPVTGTAYIGADQYADFCATRVVAEAANRTRLGRNAELTGIQPGPDAKLTGNARGECQTVSGSPYMGDVQQATVCGRLPMATHYRARGPEDMTQSPGVSGNAMDAPGNRQPGDFSVVSPARSAQDSETRRITGSAFGGTGRITGSLARAAGLVSGTPEFRYRDGAEPAAPVVVAAAEPAPDRITGEGRERSVTGDAWDRSGRVTGTEGRSAASRNPTQRGESRGSVMNARVNREMEHPALAPGRVTGSSGNSTTGSAVTLSGGARG